MKLLKKVKIYLTTGLMAPMVTQCTVESHKNKIEKTRPTTESLAYLAYKDRQDHAKKHDVLVNVPVFFGDEWAI